MHDCNNHSKVDLILCSSSSSRTKPVDYAVQATVLVDHHNTSSCCLKAEQAGVVTSHQADCISCISLHYFLSFSMMYLWTFWALVPEYLDGIWNQAELDIFDVHDQEKWLDFLEDTSDLTPIFGCSSTSHILSRVHSGAPVGAMVNTTKPSQLGMCTAGRCRLSLTLAYGFNMADPCLMSNKVTHGYENFVEMTTGLLTARVETATGSCQGSWAEMC